MAHLFYRISNGDLLSVYQVQSQTGINPEISVTEVLNAVGFAPVDDVPTPEQTLYDVSTSYILETRSDGTYAAPVWSLTPKPLEEAKAIATELAKQSYNTEAHGLVDSSQVSLDIWTGAASQEPLDRPPAYASLLDSMSSIGDSLYDTLVEIDSATDVSELNNIVNPPTGVLSTGRGSGLGPEDLNPSYFVSFSSPSLNESDMELYVPGTDTVIPYDPMLPPPYIFDSMGDCFAPGDYTLQIRVAATSKVVGIITVPLNPSNEDIPF